MQEEIFSHPLNDESLEALKAQVRAVLAHAKEAGAEGCEVLARRSLSVEQGIAAGQQDPLHTSATHELHLAVYRGQRKGRHTVALDTAFDPRVAVDEALAIAAGAEKDPSQGPALERDLAWNPANLELCHDWPLSPEDLLGRAQACERATDLGDARILGSRRTSISALGKAQVFGNSHGLVVGYLDTLYQLSTYVRAQIDDERRTAGEFKLARSLAGLGEAGELGNLAARRAIDHLGSQRLPVQRCAHVFAPSTSIWLLSALIQALQGKPVSEGRSVLAGRLDEPLFAPGIGITEAPRQMGGLGSSPFDLEGCAIDAGPFVENGRLLRYALDSVSARRLGMANTGNAAVAFEEARNLTFTPGSGDQAQLLASMGRGVFVSEARAPQVDVEKGSFMLKGIGFWVEDGVIQYPLEPFVIESPLLELWRKVSAVGGDLQRISRISGVSVLVDDLPVHH